MRTPLTTRSRRAAVAVAGVLLAVGATGCEPTEPPAFTVDSTALGADADPGDRVCATAEGDCTLQAAVEEANELDTKTVITLPESTIAAADLTVTGVVELVGSVADEPNANLVSWTVAEGASLAVTDAALGPVVVEGTFLARRVLLGLGPEAPIEGPDPLVRVTATGTALLTNADALAWGGAPLAVNDGVLSIHGTTIRPQAAPGPAAITTGEGGQTRLSATAVVGGDEVVDVCAGEAPTSYGYNLVPNASCGLTMEGDQQDFDGWDGVPTSPDDPRVDAIPVGTLHCGAGWDDDMTSRGNPIRPFDGDEDETPACDVGAHELAIR